MRTISELVNTEDPGIEKIREWVRSASVAWRYGEPGPDYYERIVQRLPAGLRSLLAAGIEEGLILPEGPKFTLRGLTGKGPTRGSANVPRPVSLLRIGSISSRPPSLLDCRDSRQLMG